MRTLPSAEARPGVYGTRHNSPCPVLSRWVQDPVSRMWWPLALLCSLLVLTRAQGRTSFHPLSDDLITYINKQNTTWQVGCGAASCVCPYVTAGVGLCTQWLPGGHRTFCVGRLKLRIALSYSLPVLCAPGDRHDQVSPGSRGVEE